MFPLYAAGFVTAFGAHAIAANLGPFATGHHTSLWALGLLLGVYDGAEVVLKPVFGSVVDRVGAKPVMLAGLVVFALASLGFAFAGSSGGGGLAVARLVQGSAAAAFSPAAGAAIAQMGAKKRTGRMFGGYGGAKSIGYLLGPLAGGALVSAGGYRLLFFVSGAVAIAAALSVFFQLPSLGVPGRKARSGVADLVRQIRAPSFVRPVVLLAAATGALSAGVGFLPLMGSRHGLSSLETGVVVSLLSLTAALVQPVVGRRHDDDRLPSFASSVALLLAAVGFGLAAVGSHVVLLGAAAILIGVAVGVVTPVGFARLAAGAPPDRLGRTMGAGEVGRELGDAGGPVIVGAFAMISLGVGLGALGVVLLVCAGLAVEWRGVAEGRPS